MFTSKVSHFSTKTHTHNRSPSYIAPRLYNKLLITIELIDSLNTFKSHLKAFLFSCAYDQSGLTVQEYAL